jgi:two-component system NarL family sensor kinase
MSDPITSPSDVLMDAAQIVEAIRSGAVDAFVVEEHEGRTVYTLQSADLPYHALVQKMQMGAAMLNPNLEIAYCNPGLAALLGFNTETLVGAPFQSLLHSDDRNLFHQMIVATEVGSGEGEVRLRRVDETFIPAKLFVTILSRDKSMIGALVADLSTEKANAELAARIQRLQDEERRGIARELHDGVGQSLAAITMNLARIRKEAAARDPQLMALVEDSAIMVDQVTKEIRTISHLLHPPLLDVAGLSAAIRWYVDGFSERSGVKVQVDVPTDCGRLSSEAEIAAFRVVQECLTNIYRHSGSRTCSIRMSKERESLKIEIRDEGQGIAAQRKANGRFSSGLGLRGMEERLRQLGGKLEVISNEQGTVVIATLPLSPQTADQTQAEPA